MKTRTCSGHEAGAIPKSVHELPSSQGGEWRHICAACAYELGRRHAEETEARLRERIRELMEKVK